MGDRERDDEGGKDGGEKGGGGRQEKVRGGSSSKLVIEPSAWWLDVPLEFVREVARARAVAEAGHVEGGTGARHDGYDGRLMRK